MSLPWFRLYHELKDDPKIGMLDDAAFRVFIESLCWACESASGGGTGLTLANANWAFRRTVTTPLQSLFQCGLLAENKAGEIFVPKWEDRQKPSDDSAQRVRKHRAKQAVTVTSPLQSRPCNAIEESRGEEIRGEEIRREVHSPEVSVNQRRLAGAPCPPGRTEEIKRRLSEMFQRKNGDEWSYMDESLLVEVSRREACESELGEIIKLKAREPKYFPRSVSKLLADWTGHLDRSRCQPASVSESDGFKL